MGEVLEKTVVKAILKYLRGRGGFWFKTHGGPYQMAGLPDIIGCFKGRFVGIEVKVPGREESGVTPIQRHVLDQIIEAGGIAGVATSPEDARIIVNEGTYQKQRTPQRSLGSPEAGNSSSDTDS